MFVFLHSVSLRTSGSGYTQSFCDYSIICRQLNNKVWRFFFSHTIKSRYCLVVYEGRLKYTAINLNTERSTKPILLQYTCLTHSWVLCHTKGYSPVMITRQTHIWYISIFIRGRIVLGKTYALWLKTCICTSVCRLALYSQRHSDWRN